MNPTEIKRILVPFDFSEIAEIALDEAFSLASIFKAELFIIHVMEQSSYGFISGKEIPDLNVPEEQLADKVRKELINISEKYATAHNLSPEIEMATGHIHDEILDYVDQMKIDLIVMGTHGAKGYKEIFVGSNTQRIVDLAEIPVLTFLNNIPQKKFRNILVPIDNSFHSREKVNLALVFAEKFSAKIHIIGLPDSDEPDHVSKFRVKIKSVEDLAKENSIDYISKIIHESSVADAAIKYATHNHCDLIVINTGHESRIPGLFSQQIVNHATTPVLSLRHSESSYSIDTPGYGI
jgi:nucleotide-binding universal stress UspA family protein